MTGKLCSSPEAFNMNNTFRLVISLILQTVICLNVGRPWRHEKSVWSSRLSESQQVKEYRCFVRAPDSFEVSCEDVSPQFS